MTRTWTPHQELAIGLAGADLLVSAAAGAGKTAVLVERVIRAITRQTDPVSLDSLLVVTFTEKAASEMKSRIRDSLVAASQARPKDNYLLAQMRAMDRAEISTIHAFCLRILRQYYHQVGLDPAFRVLDANEAELLRMDAAAELFESMYDDKTEAGATFRATVERYGGRGVDEGLRDTVLRLHDYARTQPSFTGFLKEAKEGASGEDGRWLWLLLDGACKSLDRAEELTAQAREIALLPGGPSSYVETLDDDVCQYKEAKDLILAALSTKGQRDLSFALPHLSLARARIAEMTPARLKASRGSDPDMREEAKGLRDMAKKVMDSVKEAAFMRPLEDLLGELRGTERFITCLSDIVEALDERYLDKKRDRGGVDFSDLERYCLLVLEKEGGRIAKVVAERYTQVFVDEYQDVNPLQERILSLVSRENRFMVGDLKQSIYRFRLAEPRLFLDKLRRFERVAPGQITGREDGWRVDLHKSFRSRHQVVEGVNQVFTSVMTESVADIDYYPDHLLDVGAQYPEAKDDLTPELHLVERDSDGSADDGGDDGAGDLEEFEALEKEALVVASRIMEMVDPGDPLRLWDREAGISRPCSFRDIAVLMRSTKERANAVLDIFSRFDIPCFADVGTGYFRAREVEVALSLLRVIDNPIDDISLAATLRSPIGGLVPEDLAAVRAARKKGSFYDALKAAAGLSPIESPEDLPEPVRQRLHDLQDRLSAFFDSLSRWRTWVRRRPLADALWGVWNETGYHDYVGGLPGGRGRQANLRALLDRAREFDSFGRHGLARFLQFIEKLEDAKTDLGTSRALGEGEDVVRLMSIHKAKGLEFPVVFVMDLGKRHNMEDIRRDILFHRDVGVGALAVDLDARLRYPTALHQAIAQKIRHENLAEEMRVLYVALTRAKEKLCLVGSARNLDKTMRRMERSDPLASTTYLDWVYPRAKEPLFHRHLWGGAQGKPLPLPPPQKAGDRELWDAVKKLSPPPSAIPHIASQVAERLAWTYPHQALTVERAKLSVGELKRVMDMVEGEEERFLPRPTRRLGMEEGREHRSALERGIAIHAILSRIDLTQVQSEGAIKKAMERMKERGEWPAGVGMVDPSDLRSIARFFQSPAGISIRECPGIVRREAPFTIRIPALGGGDAVALGDWVVVQGIIDVLLDEPDGLTILDFKSDRVGRDDIGSRAQAYTSQVALYALAAGRIYKKPVKKASLVFLVPEMEVPVDWRAYLWSQGLMVPS